MTPLRFEQLYEHEWTELATLLAALRGGHAADAAIRLEAGARLPPLYRRACEHLALARARAYPVDIIDRLETLTTDAHQRIYYQHELGLVRLRRLFTHDFPASVRRHRGYVWVAMALFVLPTLALGLLVYRQPELILSVVSANTVTSMERMYSPDAAAFGRTRDAGTDWTMFGYYIRNNISVAFQCYAGGFFAGLGSVFFLAFNGAFGGAIAGYLAERGLSPTFFSFVVTHSAFEITAIVISGAAGLRLGHAWIAPGPTTRRRAMIEAARDSVVLIYGVIAMLILAAAIEAFWSSASWISAGLKYGVAAGCWLAVFVYFAWQGRRAD